MFLLYVYIIAQTTNTRDLKMTDYYESAKEVQITQGRAFKELSNHGINHYDEFLQECGNKAFYDAQEVLDFLGY